MRRHPLAQMLTIGVIASIIGVALVLLLDWFPPQASEQAEQIDTLYDVLLIASVPIFVLVMTIAIYSVVKFRARPGDKRDGAPIHGNTLLEVIWVTIPFVLVTSLAIYGWIVLDDIEDPQPDTMIVNVTAQQFAWSFEYPQEGAEPVQSNELVLPLGRPVEFQIEALDVIHSFWVPAFRLKQDAVPGITTETRLTPSEEGRFDVVCAELCGLGHSTMRQTARVVQPEEFTTWLEERQQGGMAAGAEGGGEQAAAGAEVFTATGCSGCHTLADAGSTSETGPSLDELADVATKRDPDLSPEEYVEESIVDPEALVVDGFPAGTMPGNYEQQLAPEEIDALVEYLLDAGGKGGGEAQ